MRFTNASNLPPHVAAVLESAWRNTAYDGPRGHRIITVSQLIGPAQALQLVRAHEDLVTMDVMETVPALFGSAIHHLLDLAGEAAPALVREERLSAPFLGWTVSGKPDVFVTGDNRLVDYKSGSVWSYILGKPEWVAQLNIYAWLIEITGGHVADLEVVLLCKDWRRGESRQNSDYPLPVQPIPIPRWSLDETRAYMEERLARHEADPPPPCTSEERWQRPSTWAAKKPTNKRARAVYQSEVAALADVKAGEIVEYRPGESVRCASWCPARTFCPQWAADPTNPANKKEEEE